VSGRERLAGAAQPSVDRFSAVLDRLEPVTDPLARGPCGEAPPRQLIALGAAGGERLLSLLAAVLDPL
jgi:hypothetical protein